MSSKNDSCIKILSLKNFGPKKYWSMNIFAPNSSNIILVKKIQSKDNWGKKKLGPKEFDKKNPNKQFGPKIILEYKYFVQTIFFSF